MGIRTYIYGVDTPNIDDVNLEHHHYPDNYVCLGKMAAYIDSLDVPKLETVKWLEKHLTDADDKDYLEQYKDVGYCNEYVTFNQVFKHEEMLEFVEAYYNDKVSKSPWNNVYGLSDVILLLENYDYFVIEWTGG